MNKKADVEISLKTLIGFVLVAIIFFAFVGFFVKMWGIFLNKPNQATINSFKNLVYEINELEDGDEKLVPFFIQEGLFLKSLCDRPDEKRVENDICICKRLEDCRKREIREPIKGVKKVSLENINRYIGYTENKEIINLKITRTSDEIKIHET